MARLTSPQVVASSKRALHFGGGAGCSTANERTGCFLNLHCGHNNQYSVEERERLRELIEEAVNSSSSN